MPNPVLASSDAVHLLYRAHHGWLHGWLRAKLGNAFDAADLAQDTFLRVLRHRHELDALREPRAYLTTIAKRLLMNHHRRRSVEQAYLEALAIYHRNGRPDVISKRLATARGLVKGLKPDDQRPMLNKIEDLEKKNDGPFGSLDDFFEMFDV